MLDEREDPFGERPNGDSGGVTEGATSVTSALGHLCVIHRTSGDRGEIGAGVGEEQSPGRHLHLEIVLHGAEGPAGVTDQVTDRPLSQPFLVELGVCDPVDQLHESGGGIGEPSPRLVRSLHEQKRSPHQQGRK